MQTIVLDEAAQAHPDSWWWLKTDGCDIVKGLKESTKLQWSGDVDLNDGSLQEQYETYRKRLEFVKKLGLNIEHCEVTGQLKRILDDISDDLKFIYSGKNSNNKFSLDTTILYSQCHCLKSYRAAKRQEGTKL